MSDKSGVASRLGRDVGGGTVSSEDLTTLALCAWSCRTHSRDWTTTTVFFDIDFEEFNFAPDPSKEERLVNEACIMNRDGSDDKDGERRDGNRTSYDWATYPSRPLRW